jgi:uncharacterized membrane protein
MISHSDRVEQEKETGRIEVFSDGIFAIAATLLILNIRVPTAAEVRARGALINALLAQWPALFSYANSFLTILIMWINHHKLFRHIRRSDHIFLVLNGLLLMGVTFVPFPTAILSEYIKSPDSKTAVALYSGTFFVIAILFYVLWQYASRGHRLLARSDNPAAIAAISRQYHFGPPLYLVAFLFAFWNIWASVGMCTALAIFFALPGVKRTRSASDVLAQS